MSKLPRKEGNIEHFDRPHLKRIPEQGRQGKKSNRHQCGEVGRREKNEQPQRSRRLSKI
jgi:hypothetical protein